MVHTSLEPFNLSPPDTTDGYVKVIENTRFPWYDRFDRFVCTLGESFSVFGIPSIAGITVQINGRPTTITPDPMNPQAGHWSYDDRGNAFVMQFGEFEFAVEYFYNGNRIDRHTLKVYVCSAIPVDSGDDQPNDFVRTTSTLYYKPEPAVDSTSNPDTNPTRKIHNKFKVTFPGSVNGLTSGITVGIIQTANEESSFGPITYTRAGTTTTGTRTDGLVDPYVFPLWDGDGSVPCYASPASVRSSPSNGVQEGSNWVWNGDILEVKDSPFLPLPDIPWSGYTWEWGYTPYMQTIRDLGSSSTSPSFVQSFEDMLSASSSFCPNVVIPIYGYNKWKVRYWGYKDTNNIWHGGEVLNLGTGYSTQPVADTLLGPVNTKIVAPKTFTSP